MPNKNSLNSESWIEYLSTIVTQEFGTYFVDGIRMEGGVRAYHRWTKEKTTPDFFRADSWLCRYDLFIQDFINFCRQNDMPVWHENEPEWARDIVEDEVPEIV